MKTRRRLIYIVLRFAEALLSSFSRFFNAVLFDGSTAQTISSRAWIEGLSDPVWRSRQVFIDRVFFFQPSHCHWSWETEVTNALKTLAQNT